MKLEHHQNLSKIAEQITVAHVRELKALPAMSPVVGDVMKAVMVIFQKPETYGQIKIELRFENRFVNRIREFSKSITTVDNPIKLTKLRKYTSKSWFNPLDISRESVAACYLCEWVLTFQLCARNDPEMRMTPLGLIPRKFLDINGLSLDFMRNQKSFFNSPDFGSSLDNIDLKPRAHSRQASLNSSFNPRRRIGG